MLAGLVFLFLLFAFFFYFPFGGGEERGAMGGFGLRRSEKKGGKNRERGKGGDIEGEEK